MKNNTEPAVTVASITAAVAAVLALLAAFGLPVSPEQQTAILGVVAVIGPLVVGVLARRFVVPVSKLPAEGEPDSDPDGLNSI